MSQCPRPKLRAALEPADDTVVGQDVRTFGGQIVGPFEDYPGRRQLPRDVIVTESSSRIDTVDRDDPVAPLRGDSQRAQLGPGVTGSWLNPDRLERSLIVDAGVRNAIECHPPGHRQIRRTGLLVQPAGQVEEHLFDHPLDTAGQIGVFGNEGPDGVPRGAKISRSNGSVTK